MIDIPFIHVPNSIEKFLDEENELFVDAGGVPGFEFASEEESKKILKDISRKAILQDSSFLLKFFLSSYAITWRSINNHQKELINYIERYVLCPSSHNVNHSEEEIKFENNLIFPYGRKNESIQGNVVLGPKIPEMMKVKEGYGIKILTGLEKEKEIIKAINLNKLDPKIYSKYLDSIV